MRPIDADALKQEIFRYANEPIKLNDRRWDTRCVAICEDMNGMIDLASTIDAEPVRRGRWTTKRTWTPWTHDGEWYCSECDYEPTVFENTPYCPHCGAKMDGGESE